MSQEQKIVADEHEARFLKTLNFDWRNENET